VHQRRNSTNSGLFAGLARVMSGLRSPTDASPLRRHGSSLDADAVSGLLLYSQLSLPGLPGPDQLDQFLAAAASPPRLVAAASSPSRLLAASSPTRLIQEGTPPAAAAAAGGEGGAATTGSEQAATGSAQAAATAGDRPKRGSEHAAAAEADDGTAQQIKRAKLAVVPPAAGGVPASAEPPSLPAPCPDDVRAAQAWLSMMQH
jgi:hypothetical protein